MRLILEHEVKFVFTELPKQWLLRQQLFDIEFPGFPMVYIHNIVDGIRVFGFPAHIGLKQTNADTIDVEVLFISNTDLNSNEKARLAIQDELANRIGIANKVTRKDIDIICEGPVADKYRDFLLALWDRCERPFGKELPYGKMFEEVECIVRFVSAWAPKTGRQSEIRMKYNFFSHFGEKVIVKGPWSFIDFTLLPTAEEIRSGSLDAFPKFRVLFSAMRKLWTVYYTKNIETDSGAFRSMESAWESNKENFIKDVSTPMLNMEGVNRFTPEEKNSSEALVDAFNRHAWRAAFFIWSIMTLHEQGFDSWTKKKFIDFYTMKDSKGVSPKVVACFLQQGFKNDEAIPIDTWVESFYEHALGIEDRISFINTFQKVGKLERLIWLASQANKINLKPFYYTLWCTRYGTRNNTSLRGANPVSCYECELKSCCEGYKKIMNDKVYVIEETSAKLDETSAKGRFRMKNGKRLEGDERFLLVTIKGVPTKVYKKTTIRHASFWELVDEHSGYILKANQTTHLVGLSTTVDTLIASLPPMSFT